MLDFLYVIPFISADLTAMSAANLLIPRELLVDRIFLSDRFFKIVLKNIQVFRSIFLKTYFEKTLKIRPQTESS